MRNRHNTITCIIEAHFMKQPVIAFLLLCVVYNMIVARLTIQVPNRWGSSSGTPTSQLRFGSIPLSHGQSQIRRRFPSTKSSQDAQASLPHEGQGLSPTAPFPNHNPPSLSRRRGMFLYLNSCYAYICIIAP